MMEGLRGARYAYRVQYKDVRAYLLLGWIAYEPSYFDYQHLYGIMMFWICDCPPPFPPKDPHQ